MADEILGSEELGGGDEPLAKPVEILEKPIEPVGIPVYEKRPAVALTDAQGTAVTIRGRVAVHGALDSSAQAALVVEKYTDAEFAKGAGKRKPYELSIDNERD